MYALRLRGPIADDPSARVLHYLLVGFGIALITELAGAPFWHGKIVAASLILFFFLTILSALILVNRGYFRLASWMYLSGTWLVSTIIIILGGGARSQDVVFYIALSISAAWLVGYGAALLIAGTCIVGLLVMALLDVNGMPLPRLFPGEPIPNWVNFVVAMAIAAVPVGRVLQMLRETLNRSQKAEAALREHQEHLEELVRQRTAELEEARDQAQIASQSKTAFLANMSHELRTPLNAILGFSNLLRNGELAERQRKDLDIINRSGEHLLTLINGVLDLARIEAGLTETEIGPCNPRSIAGHVAEMMRVRAGEKNLALLVTESPEFPHTVRMDGAKLRQILINLLGNAVKYTERGIVTLRLHARPDGDQCLLLKFEVEDTGIGIPTEDQSRIFDSFVQLGGQRNQKGSGLGLSITRQFVKLMDGTIEVESIPGKGSRFRVELPADPATEPEVRPSLVEWREITGLETGQPDYRILIVENEEENRVLLQRLLQGAGFQVRMVGDGARGVEMFQQWQPHFIWMDLRMPVMDGREATRCIRALEGGREVKIAIVTASAFASEREEVLASGVDDFIRKPYRPSEIFDCMARHLGLRYRFGVPSTPTESASVALRPEDLNALPKELQTELANALVALDVERTLQIIRRVSEHNAELAGALSYFAGRLAYTPILDALESCRSAGSEPGNP
jgi:signal transduction histidine kinase/CheY-like chemotaxis protein